MWLKKIRKKKLQCFLIGTLLFLTSLIFASSLSMITSINGYVDKYYSNEDFYDLFIFNSASVATNSILQWGESNSQVNDVKVMDAFSSGNNLYRNDKDLKLAWYNVLPLEDLTKLPFGINKVTSLNNDIHPNEGEIWLTQLMADNFDISIGDILTFKTQDKDVKLKVTSIINDSLQPSSLNSMINLYINKNNAQDFSSFMKAPLVLIDTKQGADVSKLQTDLTETVKVGGYALSKDVLAQSATSVSTTIGGICTLASLLVFIVSILLIRFILWNNILKEYKSIGIYKALGFSKGEILKFYITGYSLTAVIGSVLGALSCIPILNYTTSKVTKYIGNFDGVSVNFTAILATVFLFSLVVIINLYFVIRRTNKISPVTALRTGITSSKKKLTKSIIKNNTSPIALAVNDIFKYKKSSLYITLALTLPLALVLLFGNFNVTTVKMKENSNVWFGLPKSGITISASITSPNGAINKALSEVKMDRRVKNYVYGSISYTGVTLNTKKYPLKGTMNSVFVMNSYNSDLGFTIIDGHNPENYNEVAVSINILEDTGLSVGDYIELSINNKNNNYLISGSYNSMMNEGYGIRMLDSAIKKEFPEFVGSELFVNLKDSSQIEAFEKDINDKFDNLDADEMHPLLKYTVDSIPGTLLPVTYLLIIVFIAFSSITILNIIIVNMRDNRRNFGIMKALGFTSVEISLRYLLRILILTLVSGAVAVFFNLTAARPMIAAAVSKLDVLVISPTTMAALLTAMILLVISITLVCCKNIKNTKPTELIEE
ncbi:MAG: FtsX-like permease family protein [Clostridia bacterium]|nr:FtsX-like permease family protein [Clostridia bacterium]